MKTVLAFELDDYDYGPATAAVRDILDTWTAIDWFVPPTASHQTATALFAEHQALARLHDPDRFPASVEIAVATGDWPEFSDLCERVRTQTGWDWKFGALKSLAHEHSLAHGWILNEQVRDAPPPRQGDLLVRLGDFVIWNSVVPEPPTGIGQPSDAGFYGGYARGDVYECLEWQLAEPTCALTANPFIPLLHLYAAGYYPFSFSRTDVTLFGFR